MPARQRRAGIVGTGSIGEVHARAVRAAGGTVAGVAAASHKSAMHGADKVGAAWAAESAAALIESDDVDVVHVCTPNAQHLSIAELALKVGKPVICEKPLALSGDDAQHLVDLAAANDVVTGVPFVYRFYPSVREARARISSGDGGALRVVHGSYLQDWLSSSAQGNWRVDRRAVEGLRRHRRSLVRPDGVHNRSPDRSGLSTAGDGVRPTRRTQTIRCQHRGRRDSDLRN
jgi:predicted dehydrogenase